MHVNSNMSDMFKEKQMTSVYISIEDSPLIVAPKLNSLWGSSNLDVLVAEIGIG